MTPPETPAVQVRDLGVVFPDGNGGLQALNGVDFTIYPQEFVAVLGPSGSGKTTLLRVLAGLISPTSGSVTFSVPGDASHRPHVGLVFQQANLMPWRTLLENVALPLQLQGVEKESAQVKAQELIDLVGLHGFEHNWPHDLSGGMAQRVAIARSLVQDPDLLLLDEPFGSLDALTREKMGSELLRIWQARCKTVLLVTHSISEALFLSDRVLVLTPRPGRVCLDMKVDLARPRQEDIRYTPHFGELARALREAIS